MVKFRISPRSSVCRDHLTRGERNKRGETNPALPFSIDGIHRVPTSPAPAIPEHPKDHARGLHAANRGPKVSNERLERKTKTKAMSILVIIFNVNI